MTLTPGEALLLALVVLSVGYAAWRLGRALSSRHAWPEVPPDVTLFERLPEITGRMLTASSRREIGMFAVRLVDLLLQPEQVAFFVARPVHRRLALVAGQGLHPELAVSYEVDYGAGRIGHVAETRVTMDAGDFARAGPLVKPEPAELRALRAELVAPLEDDEGLVGVLCVGGARIRRGYEKQALGMVARLTASAIVQLKRLRASWDAASIDGLTGCYNKQYFQERLELELLRAQRERSRFSLLFIDIDNFKNYNDSAGHQAGDEALRKIGQLLRGSVREDDVVARYGGEEFVILYRDAPKELAVRLAEGLRRAVEAFPFAYRDRQPLGALTISGGVASFPEDSDSALAVVRQADLALYEAKARGRNRIVAARRSAMNG